VKNYLEERMRRRKKETKQDGKTVEVEVPGETLNPDVPINAETVACGDPHSHHKHRGHAQESNHKSRLQLPTVCLSSLLCNKDDACGRGWHGLSNQPRGSPKGNVLAVARRGHAGGLASGWAVTSLGIALSTVRGPRMNVVCGIDGSVESVIKGRRQYF
jgi:hypothetical protein